jgi:hypothetical protein
MRDETRPTTMHNDSALSEEQSPVVGIVPTAMAFSGPLGVRNGPPDPPSVRSAIRLLAGLPQWRKTRRRLYNFGLLVSPIPSFLLCRYLVGPDWWQAPYVIAGAWIAYVLAYVSLWDWLSVKYKRAISVVLNASEEPLVGPMIDASCLLAVSYGPWAEVKRALIDRLDHITSPDDDSLTDTQLAVLHDIVLGRQMPTSFNTASHIIILNALVHLGDTRTVACLEDLIGGGGKFRQKEGARATAQKRLANTFVLMGKTRSAAGLKVEELFREGGKTRDPAGVQATAQQCLVRLQARLAAESLCASLLRSSDRSASAEATLLRPATPAADATAPEQLLRAHSKS